MASNEEVKVFLHQDNPQCHKLIRTMAKLHQLHFDFLLHPPYSQDLVPNEYYLLANLKKMVAGRKYGSSAALIETLKCFKGLNKSFYQKT